MKTWAIIMLVLLAVLHQDFWLWSDTSLLWEVVPVGLAYHAGISLAATALWLGVARFAWPADEPSQEGSS